MKISTQATRYINEHYGSAGDPAPNGVGELIEKIGAQLGAVEETVAFGARFTDVIIVKVVSCEDHPNADRLHVCMVDDGGVVPDVTRDENGHIQIVCGAPNVRVGMLAAWLPPGSTVPSTVDEPEPFVLSARELRGVVSNGMMASPKELSLGDNHDGILDIDEELGPIAPGTAFVDAFHLRDDVIIAIENKMFTHRPDCFGWLGIARELAGIQGQAYKSPDWYRIDPEVPAIETDELPLEVTNEIPDLVPRFAAIVLRDVQIKPSPVWLQVDLARIGLRSINNIVDYTNFYMVLTGQPIHAYDYDKVKAFSGDGTAKLTIRFPRSGEKITMLNGKTIEPRPEAMMVAAGDHLACVGGAMGGADTEIGPDTKHIILEAATWDMYSMRRTSMTHGIFTDAVTRFNKGQSPLQNLATLVKLVNQIRDHAGGKIAGPVIDSNHVPEEARQRGNIHAPVVTTAQFINARLGWQLTADDMRKLLSNVEFRVDSNADELTVTAPFWRTDIESPEDIVEEIGRLHGFDKLSLDLPQRDITPAVKNPMLALHDQIRQVLSSSGANELLTYSFVHGNLLDKVGQDREQAFQLSNALSPDLQFFRLSLTPSLLDKVHANLKAGHDQFALYEIGKVHNKREQDDEGLPREQGALSLVFAASDRVAGQLAGAPYYRARSYITTLLDHFGVLYSVRFEPLEGADLYGNPWVEQLVAPFTPQRSAVLRDEQGLIWGVVGEYRAAVRRNLKLPATIAGFEVNPLLFTQATPKSRYTQLPKFPSIDQDICLKVPANTAYDDVLEFTRNYLQTEGIDKTYFTTEPVDIYQRPDDLDHKQITLRLSFAHYERTLTDVEINKLLDKLAQAAATDLQAERV